MGAQTQGSARRATVAGLCDTIPLGLADLAGLSDAIPVGIGRSGWAEGSSPQEPSGALKARLILIRDEAGRWPAMAKRAMNPGRCPTVVELRQKGSVARPSGEERDWSLDISGRALS